MPYIDMEKRKMFDTEINALAEALKKDPENFEGNLNYIFSRIILGTAYSALGASA